ncbi:hypothetical protein ES703_107201 [subsurface metagenome]
MEDLGRVIPEDFHRIFESMVYTLEAIHSEFKRLNESVEEIKESVKENRDKR